MALAGLLIIEPAVVGGATVTTAWQAKIGSAGVNGTAKVQAFSTGTGSLTLKLAKMRATAYLPVTISKGTCSSVGATLIKFPSIKSTSSGTASRTSSLSSSQTTLIKNATKGAGKIAIRVGSRTTGGVKCGLFTGVVLPVASPSPSPATGDTLYMGPYYSLTVPAGWVPASDGSPGYAKVVFAGPAGQMMRANSGPTTITLDDLTAEFISSVKSFDGVDPERNEAITMAGVPGRMLAYHFTNAAGLNAYEIDAFCVNGGRAYMLSHANQAGAEGADSTFFTEELASFRFGPGF